MVAPVSKADWDQYVHDNSDAQGKICIVARLPSGSFLAIFPPMFDELATLHRACALPSIYLGADATWKVEADEFTQLATFTYSAVVSTYCYRLVFPVYLFLLEKLTPQSQPPVALKPSIFIEVSRHHRRRVRVP